MHAGSWGKEGNLYLNKDNKDLYKMNRKMERRKEKKMEPEQKKDEEQEDGDQ